MKKLAGFLIILSAICLYGCSSGVESDIFPNFGVKDGDVIRIEITGTLNNSQWSEGQLFKTAAFDRGTTMQLSLVGYDVNNSIDNTIDATWTSSDPQVAAVDSKGKITAISAGETIITVRLMSTVTGEVISDTIAVTVLPSPVTGQQWTLAETYLPQEIWDHGSAAWNGYLYVAGGNANCTADYQNCGFTNKIYYTKINKTDGSVGDFNQTTLPSFFSGGLRGHSLLAYNGYLYIIGGIVHPTFPEPPYPSSSNFDTILNEKVFYAVINPEDGSLGAWIETSPLPPPENAYPPIPADKAGLFALSATVHTISKDGKDKGYIYVTGGWSAELKENVRTVFIGPINNEDNMPDALPGSIGKWIHNDSSDLPYDLSKHTSVTASVNGSSYIYVIGGNSGSYGSQEFRKEIVYAKIAEDGILSETMKNGQLSTWHHASNSLPEQLIDHASVSTGSHIFVIGGRSGVESSNYEEDPKNFIDNEDYKKFKEVVFFRIDDTGDLQPLQRCADLPLPLFHHAAVTDINTLDESINIYVTGGAGGDTAIQTNRKNTVYYINTKP